MKYFLVLFLAFNYVFADELIFMVETQGHKHIGKLNGKSYSLITKENSWHLYPDISNDSNKYLFVKGTSRENLQIVLRNKLSKKDKALTDKGFVLHPRFSNRSNTIFYSIKTQSGQKIQMLNLKNKDRKYIDEKYDAYFPAPFQSGEMLVYQRNLSSKDREIVLFDMLQNKKEVISKGMAPALSKDERYIAFTNKIDGNWDIYVYDRFTKEKFKATSNISMDFSPTFDRHNNLIYTSDRLENGVFSIFKQSFLSWKNKMEDEKVLLTKAGVSFYAPKISGVKKYKLSNLKDMTGESRSSFGTIKHGDKIYVVGGHQGAEHTYPPESFTARMTVYDLKTKKWSNLAPRLKPSHGFQITADGNYLYAFGGFAYEENNYPKWKSISVVERYDIKNNKWKIISHMPRNRSSNVVAKVGNLVYLIGGWDATPKSHGDLDGTFHDEIDVYNIKENTWKTLKVKLPLKRRAFNSFVKDGKIYLVGGISEGASHFSLLDNFSVFDTKSASFNELAKLPFGTFAPACGNIGDEAYMFGGMFKTGKWSYEYVPHIFKYDFKKKKWENTARYLNEYKGFSQVTGFNASCLTILGGHSYKNNEDRPVNTVEKFCVK
ncbi:MAG: hypothetical protein N4A33_10285 [Bacteriovoracaceae bacterium]|jgi:N-acetylneuraminic acid mutarotase|nr:hypothetical protein [Bacteriovoracaceae bacterium]